MTNSPSPLKGSWVRWSLAAVAAITVSSIFWFAGKRSSDGPTVAIDPSVPELLRAELTLRDGHLSRNGTSNYFTGIMLERFPDGVLKSRSAISNGLLHGPSEGWYTNGQLQVTEHFTSGISDGLRVKWHPNGTKASEAQIVDGQLHGRFVSWYDTGVMSTELELRRGRPDGRSAAYYSSGSLKSEVTMRDGQVVKQKNWNDGEYAQAPGSFSRAP